MLTNTLLMIVLSRVRRSVQRQSSAATPLCGAPAAARCWFLLRLQRAQIALQPVEPPLPEVAIVRHPVGHFLQRCWGDAAGPPLRFAALRDQTGPLEDLEVARDGGEADVERLGELIHRRLAGGETREDGAPRRVSEGGERGAESVWHVVNRCVNYLCG